MGLVSVNNLRGNISGYKKTWSGEGRIIKIEQIKLRIKLLHLTIFQRCARFERKLHFAAIEPERSSICNNGKLTLHEGCLPCPQMKFILRIRNRLNFRVQIIFFAYRIYIYIVISYDEENLIEQYGKNEFAKKI